MCDDKPKDSKEKDDVPIGRIITYSVISVFVLWGLTFLLFFLKDPTFGRGEFGDMFGAVNALFSGLAFAGLIITLILQRQELGLQREELEQTREELKNQRMEFEKENETLKYQRFENLFYNMLNLQQEIVTGLRYDYEEVESMFVTNASNNHLRKDNHRVRMTVVGREVFRFTFEEVDVDYPERTTLGIVRNKGYRSFLSRNGVAAYDDTRIPARFDHYFRHLYKIIQFVDSQGFPFEEAYKYVAMLKGTLSRYELVWIYYNALNPSFANFKKLIEKYSLLKNLRRDLLTKSLETDLYYKKRGIDLDTIKDNRFTGRDFEYFLTDKADKERKYHISAFWRKEELNKGQQILDSWKAFACGL